MEELKRNAYSIDSVDRRERTEEDKHVLYSSTKVNVYFANIRFSNQVVWKPMPRDVFSECLFTSQFHHTTGYCN